jgi:hypothetical protein
MLLQLLIGPAVPPLPLPVLRPVESVAIPISMLAAPAPATATSVEPIRHQPVPLPVMPLLYCFGVVLFIARLLRAYWFTRALLNRAERIGPRLFQSSEIAVPVTAASKIILPLDWREWEAPKLRAVLAHEEAHVRRRDSLVAVVARVNRCVFWFHPLAWWLERELAQLAEQACDDAAVAATQDREQYARTLLDMARAVHASQGRFLTSAMAKEANVETRINRILDDSRRIPKALGRAAWTALAACAGPLIYIAAAVQLAPAQTVMSIPAPAVPAPPVLIAQAPPEATTPAPPHPLEAAPPVAPSRTLTVVPASSPQGSIVLQAEPIDPAQRLPKPSDSEFISRNAGWLTAGSAEALDSPKISIAFSPLRSGVLSIPLGADVDHRVIARVTDRDGNFVASVDHAAKASSWELPFSLKPGSYRLTVTIKTGKALTGSRLDFTVE